MTRYVYRYSNKYTLDLDVNDDNTDDKNDIFKSDVIKGIK
jgi:hypothetical protein